MRQGIFARLLGKTLAWSRHPKAPWYLASLSFAESSFFPIPPDVMLAPMVLARPEAAWRLAWITTLASVLGGVAGYLIGYGFFALIEPWLAASRYWAAFETARAGFETWGVWAVLVAGFSPIPYKAFTIAAGVMGMPLLPFVLASFAGRGSRFFLVAWLMRWGGQRGLEARLFRVVDRLGWATVVVLLLALGWYYGLR